MTNNENKVNSDSSGSLKDTIGELFSGIVSGMKEERIKELQGKGITEFKEYKSLDDWFYGVLYPIQNLILGYLAIGKVKEEREFLFENVKFIEHHLDNIITKTEGRVCSHDKTSYIINSLLLISKGIEVDFEIGEKCFWICKKPLLNTEEKVLEFYKLIQQLYYGNIEEYLIWYHNNVLQNLNIKNKSE